MPSYSNEEMDYIRNVSIANVVSMVAIIILSVVLALVKTTYTMAIISALCLACCIFVSTCIWAGIFLIFTRRDLNRVTNDNSNNNSNTNASTLPRIERVIVIPVTTNSNNTKEVELVSKTYIANVSSVYCDICIDEKDKITIIEQP